MRRYIKYLFLISLFLPLSAFALTTFITTQGGTGSTTPSGILSGDNGATSHLNTVTIGTGLNFSGGTLSNTGANFSYPFPNQLGGGNATSSLTGFSGGVIVTASSTVNADLHVNGNGLFIGGTYSFGTTTQSDDMVAIQANGTKLILDTYNDSGASVFHIGNSGTVSIAGIIDSGTWNGSAITDTYISSAPVWNAKLSSYDAFTHPASGQSATTSLMILSGGFISSASSSVGALLNMTYASSSQMTVSNALYIPSVSTSTLNATGQVSIVTTQATSSITYFDGTAQRSLYPDSDISGVFASSTLSFFGSFGSTGSTTIKWRNPKRDTTVTALFCSTDGGGTANVEVGNGTATSTMVVCNSIGNQAILSTNNSFTARSPLYITFGDSSAGFNYAVPTISLRSN